MSAAPASFALGGAKKKAPKKKATAKKATVKKAAAKKPAAKKPAAKKTAAKKKGAPKKGGAGSSLAYLQKQAKRLGIPLSKEGKKKTKVSLMRSIAYHGGN